MVRIIVLITVWHVWNGSNEFLGMEKDSDYHIGILKATFVCWKFIVSGPAHTDH